MADALSNLGGSLGGGGGSGSTPGWMKLLLGGLTGAGELSNILASRQRSQAVSRLLGQEKAAEALTPQQLSSRVSAATQPISQGLTNDVTNTVQAELGERGLSQAPGIFGASLASALAPYYQQNQNTALQLVMKQLGLPLEYASALGTSLPGSTNMSPLLALLMKSVAKPSPSTTPGPSSTGGTPPFIDPTGMDLSGGDASALFGG